VSSVVVCCCVANLRDLLILFILVSPPLPPLPNTLIGRLGVALVEACDQCGRSWFWGSRYLFASEERSLKCGVPVGDLQFAGLSFWKFTTVLQMAIAENCGAV
jgi:hypothetical protein